MLSGTYDTVKLSGYTLNFTQTSQTLLDGLYVRLSGHAVESFVGLTSYRQAAGIARLQPYLKTAEGKKRKQHAV